MVVVFHGLEFYWTVKWNERKVLGFSAVPLITENKHQGGSHEYFMKNMAL